jgi:Mn-dependent DtxR family transcriptional regulator
MEFGMKRIIASVRVVAVMKKLYTGAPVTVATISSELKLSPSYVEQIVSKLGRPKSCAVKKDREAATTFASLSPKPASPK